MRTVNIEYTKESYSWDSDFNKDIQRYEAELSKGHTPILIEGFYDEFIDFLKAYYNFDFNQLLLSGKNENKYFKIIDFSKSAYNFSIIAVCFYEPSKAVQFSKLANVFFTAFENGSVARSNGYDEWVEI